ncbi:MAG: TonB-dependent receptor plug domain-containing protein [Parcubacteria group bacterium]
MSDHRSKFYGRLLGGVAAISLLTAAGAQAEDLTQFDIAPQPLSSALNEFATQSKMAVLFTPELTGARVSAGLSKTAEPETALAMMLQGTGLSWRRNGDTFIIMSASDPQSGSAAGDGADGTVAALVVTAQKREENIQDVPIAISAFTQKSLEEQKIEGGFDLLKAIPNVTFSKNNFTGYNFSIRGIGTKAISATTDPGVAVSFNNASLIQNRLFEQEYFDVERVEVLRGPQGTLYGRNATAGVINVISAKPNLTELSGWIKGEAGNYHAKRLSAMVNVPLVDDKLAIRLAGALTDRQGYDYNTGTHHAVNGRDLWSGRVTIAFDPTEKIRTNLVWERFNEDDNRSRTGKQLCKRDPGQSNVGGYTLGWGPMSTPVVTGFTDSQGCLPVSLYDKSAFETPNGLALPFISFVILGGSSYAQGDQTNGISVFSPFFIGLESPDGPGHPYLPTAIPATFLYPKDPYGGLLQSQNLREINSLIDPVYRAKADVVQLGADFDLTSSLLLSTQITYDKDSVYSSQDFNRFNTVPVIRDTAALYSALPFNDPNSPSEWADLAPGGILCDPQIGCSKSIVGVDISSAKSTQWIAEARLQSAFDGPVNFSAGVNFTKFQVIADYYVFNNILTAIARTPPLNWQSDPTKCRSYIAAIYATITEYSVANTSDSLCPYIDPNPLSSIDGEGHNYFRSKNPYKLKSFASFGELYYELSPELKVTAGLRYTDDRKVFTPVPSQLLLARAVTAAGDVSRGYPARSDIKQHWGEFTGRLGVDWKSDLSFTDRTLLYAFYSRGYKGGGANPPTPGFTDRTINEVLLSGGWPYGTSPGYDHPFLKPVAQLKEATFRPEFVNAFEVGAKNTLLGGALTANGDVFFYDYKDYQVSKIIDRSVANENFDAKVWGVELEAMFAPSRNLQFVANLGYLDTAIGAGAESIDVMNRTQGDPRWMLLKPWVQDPSNCIVPVSVVAPYVEQYHTIDSGFCGGYGLHDLLAGPLMDISTGAPYDPFVYPEISGGAGVYQNLKGNELPNSPHWTMNVGAQFSHDFANSWKATVRADGYWQSQSWARVYNAVNDKLHGWYNANLSLWLENDDGLKIELYAKNILDKTPITDAFINSDDTALTTNVFTLDPRLIGLSIKKDF